jgi:hypothetical protein
LYYEVDEREGKNIFVRDNLLAVPVLVLPGVAVDGLLVIWGIAEVLVAEEQYAS